MKLSTLVARVNLHGLTTLGAGHPMEAPADGHSVGPVVVTDLCFGVDVAVPEADTAELLEVPVSRVLMPHVVVEG